MTIIKVLPYVLYAEIKETTRSNVRSTASL